jgi:hypothetical protein
MDDDKPRYCTNDGGAAFFSRPLIASSRSTYAGRAGGVDGD